MARRLDSSSIEVSKLSMTHSVGKYTYFPPCRPSQRVVSFFPVNALSVRRALIWTGWSGTGNDVWEYPLLANDGYG
jgi:hypothetical protein